MQVDMKGVFHPFKDAIVMYYDGSVHYQAGIVREGIEFSQPTYKDRNTDTAKAPSDVPPPTSLNSGTQNSRNNILSSSSGFPITDLNLGEKHHSDDNSSSSSERTPCPMKW